MSTLLSLSLWENNGKVLVTHSVLKWTLAAKKNIDLLYLGTPKNLYIRTSLLRSLGIEYLQISFKSPEIVEQSDKSSNCSDKIDWR